MPRIFMILGVVTFAVFALLFYQYSAQRQDEVQAQQFETVMTEKCSSCIFRLKIGPPYTSTNERPAFVWRLPAHG